MTTIYSVRPDIDNYAALTVEYDDQQSTYRMFNAVTRIQLPALCAQLDDTMAPGRKLGDIAYLSAFCHALSQRACRLLQPFLDQNAEIMNLQIEGMPSVDFYALHVLTLLEPIDLNRSHVRQTESNDLVDFITMSFKPELVVGQHLFRISPGNPYKLYISDSLKTSWETGNLAGAIFDPVWSDEFEVGPIWPYKKIPSDSQRPDQSTFTAIDAGLDDDELAEIQDNSQQALRELGIHARADWSPESLQKRIDEVLGTRRKKSRGKPDEQTIAFGCPFGELICEAAKWRWGKLKMGKHALYAIVSPRKTHSIMPIEFVRSVQDSKGSKSCLLIHNMIVAGKLPPAREGEYCPLI